MHCKMILFNMHNNVLTALSKRMGDSKVSELNKEGGSESAQNGTIDLKCCMKGPFEHLS